MGREFHGGEFMNRVKIRELEPSERETLDRWLRSGKLAWYQRARTLLLAVDRQQDATTIALALGLHPNTTRRWLHTFTTGGLSALQPKPHPGRAKEFDPTLADTVIALLHDAPTEHGAPDERWTQREVAAALVREGVVDRISRDTVRRLLTAKRHSWQRAKEWLRSPDPAYAFKKSGGTA
jgi:transposase